MTRRPCGSLLVAFAFAGVPAAAQARGGRASDADLAQDDINRAQQAFRDGDYAEALEAFSAAKDTIEGSDLEVPAVIYRSIARCYDQIGDVQGASAYYKRFLALVDRDAEAYDDAVRQSEQAVERLDSMIERTRLEFRLQPEDADVRVDGRKADETQVQVSPGTHQIVVSADGHDSTTLELAAAPGATVPVVVYLRRTAVARRGRGATPEEAFDWPALLVGAAAAAAATGAIFLAMSASDLEAEADDLAGGYDHASSAWTLARPGVQAKYDEAAGQRTMALTLVGVAAAAGAAALWMLLDDGGDAPEPWGARASVVAAPGGVGVAALVRF